jgi:hypothetical protein
MMTRHGSSRGPPGIGIPIVREIVRKFAGLEDE